MYILASVSPNWRLANSYGILQAAVHPSTLLLLNNLNIVDPEILYYALSTLYFLDSWGSQQSKERIITGAGPGQPGKSCLTVRTVEFNWRTSENPYVISSIEAPLKSDGWRSKFVIFHTCTTFFCENFLSHCVGLAVLVHFHPVWWGGYPNISMRNYSSSLGLHFKFEQPYKITFSPLVTR